MDSPVQVYTQRAFIGSTREVHFFFPEVTSPGSDQSLLVRWKGGGETSMKFGESSCGCETHPTKAEPGRSVASLAAFRVTGLLMRRRASVRAAIMQPRNMTSSGCRGFQDARRQQRRSPVQRARGGRIRRGVRPGRARRGRPSKLGDPVHSLGKIRPTGSLEQTISYGSAGAGDCVFPDKNKHSPRR